MTAHAPPRQVNRFEANILRLLRAFVGREPFDQVQGILKEKHAAPKCLSSDAVFLIQDTLAKGCVLYLVRAGGWRVERFLRGSAVREGRLWERTPLSERTLKFSRHSLAFLIFLTASKPGTREDRPPADEALTPADHLLYYLAYTVCRAEGEFAAWLRSLGPIQRSPLCRLAYPEDFASVPNDLIPDFAPWCGGPAGVILEAIQQELEKRRLAAERSKGQIGDWGRLRAAGLIEEATYRAFLKAAVAANRPDLARFLLLTASQLLKTADLTPAFWTGGLQGSGPTRLADRLETQRAALAFLRILLELQAWERRCRSIGYYDEDYAVAQLLKSDWERYDGEMLASRAQSILRMLEPLRMAGGADGSAPAPNP